MALPNVPVGKWVELLGTDFKSFAVAAGIPSSLNRGSLGDRSTIFTAWNSGLFDRIRNRWVSLRGGGHADWAGNGAYEFRISDLKWGILRSHFASLAATYGSPGYPPMDSNNTNQLFSPTVLRCYSSDATDDRTATIFGEDSTGATTQETIQFNGTTPVITTTVFRWIDRITMSGPNNDFIRQAFFRRDDDTTGVWPTDKTGNKNTATGVNHISGPFNVRNLPQLLGASAYYTASPTTASLVEPSSVHTYDSEHHLVDYDVYISAGGIWWGYGDSTPQTVWMFNPTTNQYFLPSPGSTTRPGGFGVTGVWDPTLKWLWLRTSSGLLSYDYPTNAWTTRHTSTVGSSSKGKMVLDNAGRKLHMISPVNSTSVVLHTYDISTPTAPVLIQTNPTGTIDLRAAPPGQPMYEGMGCVFLGGRIALFGRSLDGTKGTICSLDPNNPVWNNHDPSDGIMPPLPESTGGIWQKLFSPDDIHIVRVSEEANNVWAFRAPWSTATPFRPIGVTATLR